MAITFLPLKKIPQSLLLSSYWPFVTTFFFHFNDMKYTLNNEFSEECNVAEINSSHIT